MVLLNLVEKWLIFTSKWTTAWHHGVMDASFNTQLHHLIAQYEENIAGAAHVK